MTHRLCSLNWLRDDGSFSDKNKYRQDLLRILPELEREEKKKNYKSLYHFYGYTITQYFNQVLNER